MFPWSMVAENSEQVHTYIEKKPGCIHTHLKVPCNEYRNSPGSILEIILNLKVMEPVP